MGVVSLDLQQTDVGQGKIDYENIVNKPKINGVTLDGDLATEDLNIIIPKLVSELQNDAGYITKDVNDLASYYDKTEVDNMISTIPKFSIKVVDELPTEDISPTTIYLLRVDGDDHFQEWVYVDNEWDKLGDGNIDLSDYATYDYVNGKLADKADIASLSAVAFSGRYEDLTGQPVNLSQFTNDVGYLTEVPDGSVSRAKLSSELNANLTAVENAVDGLQNSVRDLSNTKADKTTVSALSDTVALKADKSELPTKTSDLTNDSNFAVDANYVHTDNNYTTAEKNKLAGIAAGAEVNVQSNWAQTNSSADDFIKNKPSIPTKTSDLTNDSGFITTSAIPTKVSAFTNDAGYLNEIPDDSVGLNQLDNTIVNALNNINNKANTADLASVAFSGNYNDLANKPTIPDKTSDLTNDSGFITSADYASSATGGVVKITNAFGTTMSETGEVKGVVVSGTDYPAMWNDAIVSKGTLENALSIKRFATLSDIPTKTSDLTNDSNFVSNTSYATANTGGVVKVGSGLSITNGVLSATGGGEADTVEWDNVLNKPSFSTVATSGSYNDLSNKPTIPTVNNATLTIQRNNTGIGTFTANASSNKTINIEVPTATSDLTNDSGFIASITKITNAEIDAIMGVA